MSGSEVLIFLIAKRLAERATQEVSVEQQTLLLQATLETRLNWNSLDFARDR